MTAPALKPRVLRDRLREARDRTLQLVAPLSDADVTRQHSPLMSPIVWDLGHIAHFEEVWLLENVDGAGPGAEGLRGIYDAFRHPRATRDRLPLPDRATCLDYLARCGARCFARWKGSIRARTPRSSAAATSSTWCCSTNTSTTRRSCRRSS